MDAPERDKETAEQDPRFPSGEWKGFFLQPRFFSGRIKMTLHLSFNNGGIRGEGQDLAGKFILRGKYDIESGEVILHKRYRQAHDVLYRGFAEATGIGIWGVWEIPQSDRGGWHIWPKGKDVHDGQVIEIELIEPHELVAFEGELLPTMVNIEQGSTNKALRLRGNLRVGLLDPSENRVSAQVVVGDE